MFLYKSLRVFYDVLFTEKKVLAFMKSRSHNDIHRHLLIPNLMEFP